MMYVIKQVVNPNTTPKAFTMLQPIFLHCEDGLLPGKVIGKSTHGCTVQITVDGKAGKHWFDSSVVLTQAETDAMVAEVQETINRS